MRNFLFKVLLPRILNSSLGIKPQSTKGTGRDTSTTSGCHVTKIGCFSQIVDLSCDQGRMKTVKICGVEYQGLSISLAASKWRHFKFTMRYGRIWVGVFYVLQFKTLKDLLTWKLTNQSAVGKKKQWSKWLLINKAKFAIRNYWYEFEISKL